MALIVEDGTGLVDAESYIDVAYLENYATLRGIDLSSHNTSAKEAALREGTQYLDGKYRGRYSGERLTRSQALCWPRQYGLDRDGFDLPTDKVPREVEMATAEVAIRHLQGISLEPDISAADLAVAEVDQMVGPLRERTRYFRDRVSSPIFKEVHRVLSPVLKTRGWEIIRS